MQKEKAKKPAQVSPGKLGVELMLALVFVRGLQSLAELIRFATSEILLGRFFEVGC